MMEAHAAAGRKPVSTEHDEGKDLEEKIEHNNITRLTAAIPARAILKLAKSCQHNKGVLWLSLFACLSEVKSICSARALSIDFYILLICVA